MKRTDHAAPLRAISRSSIESMIKALCLEPELDEGILGCDFCEEVVTRETLVAVYPEDEMVKLVCNRPRCIKLFALHIQRTKLR
jgi:hypothetical protein